MSCRDDDRPVVVHVVRLVDRVLASPELDTPGAALDPQELVDPLVHLTSDRLAGGEAHHCELRVLAREDDRAERRVGDRLLLDVADPAQHASPLARGRR